MAAEIRAKARKARKASAAASVARGQMDVNELFQPETPSYSPTAPRVSRQVQRRKWTEATSVEVPSPMKKRQRRHSISVIDVGAAPEETHSPFGKTQPCKSGPRITATSFCTLCSGTTGEVAKMPRSAPAATSQVTPRSIAVTTAALHGCSAKSAASKPTFGFPFIGFRSLHFSKKPLKALGLRIQVGHSAPDARCSQPRPARDDFVVLHDNGVHEVALDYCGCSNAEAEHLQLLQADCFLPRFNPKVNAFDFYDTLERLTNGFGERPPDRVHARQQLDTAKAELAKQAEAFDLFSEEQEELVPQWTEMVMAHEKDGSQKNPYVAEFEGESEAQVRLRLQQAEDKQAAEGRSSSRPRPTATNQSSGRSKSPSQLPTKSTWGSSRRKLNRDQQTLRTLQATFTPEALTQLEALSLPESTIAEDVPLFLPSALVAAWREAGSDSLQGIAGVLLKLEREIRCAQMGYALTYLRNHLHIRKRLRLDKELHVRHQAANTRAATVFARNESQISLFADLYQIAWFAVLQIEGGNESKVGFHRLQREDIRYMTDPGERRLAEIRAEEGWSEEEMDGDAGGRKDPDEEDAFFMQGTNKNVMSWIWRGTKAQGSEAAMLEAIRIEWCKAFARVRRWEEEVLMLTDETRRVSVSHEGWARVWEEKVKNVPLGSLPVDEAEGMVAYGLKQAAMHRRLAARRAGRLYSQNWGKGRRRVRWVEAPVVLIGEGDSLQAEEEDLEEAEQQEEEELEERGDLDSDDEWW
ncbi:CxC2 domain-containing protein [Mycena chlorophos]|uniref:CxC2 domain-containing protein n=1 Tax=Mycena chlorophos TaxID=658473 RepID=A0A8H6VS80_MYCCL|nr:CxC2 domain-containing protein [Mycena chlorophos]